MQQSGPGGRLRPLSADLPPEVQDLARFLRARFSELDIGVRALARLYQWDASEVSRYLHGRRIPDPDFIRRLVADAAASTVATSQQGRKSTEEMQEQGLELRIKALRLRNKRQAEVEGLRQEVANAEHDMHLAAVRERALTEKLSDREAEARLLLERVRALESEQERLRSGPRAIEQRKEKEKLELRRSSVDGELIVLREELNWERTIRIAAEQRRDELQEKLNEAHLLLTRAGGSMGDANHEFTQGEKIGYLGERAARWGGVSGLVTVPSVAYAGPVYFGVMYGLLPATAVFLRSITLAGPVISACFIYRERKVDYAYGSINVIQFMGLILVIAILFLAGFLIGHFGHFMRSF